MFNQLPLSEVQEFKFQARSRRWVEFRNVSLELGRRTQVEVVDAAGAPLGEKITATPEQLTEPPTLRFLACQDEWKTNQPGAARHPDGSPVTDPIEQGWLRHVQPSYMDVSKQNLAPKPRFLHLWFSNPAFESAKYDEVSFLDEAGEPILLGGRGSGAAHGQEPDRLNGNLHWFMATLSPGEGTNLPQRVTVQLTYTTGPLEHAQELEVIPNHSVEMSLEGGSMLSGFGQNTGGNAFVSIAVDTEHTRGRRFDVVAAGKNGTEVASTGGGRSGLMGSAFGLAQFEFTLPLNDVAEFRIGTRPLRTNEWHDVVLPEN
jgi:hypothetical protein